MHRVRASVAFASLAIMLVVGCGQAQQPPSAAASASATTASATPLVTLPSPGVHPHYPPRDLADLAALAQQGRDLREAGGESAAFECGSMVWDRVHEVDGSPARQVAADLMQVAIARRIIYASCAGYVYGTTNLSYCNCYRGDHGLLAFDREPEEVAAGKMKVTFSASDSDPNPDWQLVVDAPSRP